MAKLSQRLTLALFFSALAFGVGCSDDPDNGENELNNQNNQTNQNNDNQNNGEEPQSCDVTSWECDEFVDGPQLNERRHGHQSVVFDNGEVLLLGGLARQADSPASGTTNTWEVFDTEADEVVADDDIPEQRQEASVIQLDNGSVLAIAGRSGNVELASAAHFDPDSLEWTSLPHMNDQYDHATHLPDNRAVALGASSSGGDQSSITGQVFDPALFEWSSIESIDLDHGQLHNLVSEATPDNELFVVFTHPIDTPDGNDPDLFYFSVSAILYNFEDGTYDELETFEHIGVSLDEMDAAISTTLTYLPDSDTILTQLRTRDDEGAEGPVLAYLFDPASGTLEEQYERDPSPGRVRQVLPGDEIIYASSAQVQLYDVETDTWRAFTSFPEGIYYSSMELLPDCRLFVSGERTLDLSDAELREVDTGYCLPAE